MSVPGPSEPSDCPPASEEEGWTIDGFLSTTTDADGDGRADRIEMRCHDEDRDPLGPCNEFYVEVNGSRHLFRQYAAADGEFEFDNTDRSLTFSILPATTQRPSPLLWFRWGHFYGENSGAFERRSQHHVLLSVHDGSLVQSWYRHFDGDLHQDASGQLIIREYSCGDTPDGKRNINAVADETWSYRDGAFRRIDTHASEISVEALGVDLCDF